MSRLTIISHTEHYLTPGGTLVGLGATVTELNHLVAIFDTVTHVAMLHTTPAPASALPYTSSHIHFIALPAVGGPHGSDKLSVLFSAPTVLKTIRRALKGSDYFQFRAPTGIGVFVIPYLIFSSKKGWFKYAGNWKQAHAPLAYRFQKWLLTHQSRPVTINGFWEDQPPHCLSFENPCLTNEEVENGAVVRKHKTLQTPINFCFVGRLEPAKGVDLIIEAFAKMDASQLSKVGQIHFVGTGSKARRYQKLAETLAVPIVFHGVLSREAVHAVYQQCHAILLPSQSEGFPKVIAEAMNYGCVPIVSEVSSIGHYITDGQQGFLLEHISVQGLLDVLEHFLKLSKVSYVDMLQNISTAYLEPFTYRHYNQRLRNELVSAAANR